MNKCPKCGAFAADGARVCIVCGEKLDDTAGAAPWDGELFDYLQKMMDSVKENDAAFPKDDERWTAALSYLGPAFIYTYTKNRDSELVCYHANQACLLFAAWLLAGSAKSIPLVGGALRSMLRWLLSAFAFKGARNAVALKKEPIPFIGELGIELLR